MKTDKSQTYTISPHPPGPTYGLPTNTKGDVIVEIDDVADFTTEQQLAMVLSARAGTRYIVGRPAYARMCQAVEHLIDKEKGGILSEFRDECAFTDVIAASEAQRARINEQKVRERCTPIYVAGVPLDAKPDHIADLFAGWEVQHIHLGRSVTGTFSGWALVYVSPADADQVLGHYQSHEALINKRPVRVVKATRRADAVVAPSQPEGAK
jgi:hypothetical protein